MEIKVYYIRALKGISTRALSKQTGLSIGAINNIENEKISPRMESMEKIARALDVGIEDLYESEYKYKKRSRT